MLSVFTTQSESPEAPLGKVELDLEGAPFLEPEPDEDTTAQAQAVEVVPAHQDGPPREKSRKKLALLLGAAVLLLLAGGAGGAYFFFLRDASEAVKEAPPGVEVIVVPSVTPKPEPAPVDKFQLSWEPFWVEVPDPEGEIRFVYVKIRLLTDNQRIALQLEQKETIIRDALYYYLRHKPYSFLADMKQLDALKTEMLNIVNYYILPEITIPPDLPPGEAPPPGTPRERLRELLIEEYLIK